MEKFIGKFRERGPGKIKVGSALPDMAVGPVFVTQTNPTHHFFNPTLNVAFQSNPIPTQPIDDKYSVAYNHKCNFTKYLNPQLLAPPNVKPN